uniref:Neuromedin B n=1 Tax=Rhinopithecus roxellana TaxID=61622 RepID=A0A2K6P2J4_RHIRO
MVRRVEGARLLSSLLLFALLAADVAPLSWDLPEPRNRAGKIRVHPRGNLWATGHFMGKKSLEPPSPSPLGTAPHTSLRDQRLQLSHDLLRILLLKKALSVSLSHPRTPHPGEPGPHSNVRRAQLGPSLDPAWEELPPSTVLGCDCLTRTLWVWTPESQGSRLFPLEAELKGGTVQRKEADLPGRPYGARSRERSSPDSSPSLK